MDRQTAEKSEYFPKLVRALRNHFARWTEAREAQSKLEKQTTEARNLFKDFLVDNRLGPETAVIVDGIEYRFCTTKSTVVDPREWYKMWQAKEITEDQYFEAIKVTKEEAERIAGADQIIGILTTKVGKKADLRRDDTIGKGVERPIKVELKMPLEEAPPPKKPLHPNASGPLRRVNLKK